MGERRGQLLAAEHLHPHSHPAPMSVPATTGPVKNPTALGLPPSLTPGKKKHQPVSFPRYTAPGNPHYYVHHKSNPSQCLSGHFAKAGAPANPAVLQDHELDANLCFLTRKQELIPHSSIKCGRNGKLSWHVGCDLLLNTLG